ncbi:MAG TPA: TolC family protein, partial [Tenuifilaceae bacterium]|nr:TolC family protein [Tenuifilaceae bacterium]
MRFGKFILVLLLLFVWKGAMPQQLLTLEQCRGMALEHNHKVIIADEHVKAAESLKKSAKTQFMPSISANGMYMRTNKKFSLLENDLL